MTDQTHPLDLDAIEARADNATDGPWWNDEHDVYAGTPGDYSHQIGEVCDPDHGGGGSNNGEFIAAARTDVVALVAEIRRMHERAARRRRAMLAAQESERVLQRQIDEQAAALDARDTEIRRLTAELQQARQQTAARIATEIRQYCPDHGEADTCRIDCHCEIADEITRLYTLHAHPCTDPACGPCSFDRAIPPTTGTAEHPVTHNWQPSEVRGIERCTHPGCHARRVPAMDAATHNPAAVSGA